jgi:hypothetical protein
VALWRKLEERDHRERVNISQTQAVWRTMRVYTLYFAP